MPRSLAEHTVVSGLRNGVLELTADDGLTYEALRRQTAGLERQLPRRVAGVQQVRVRWQQEHEKPQ